MTVQDLIERLQAMPQSYEVSLAVVTPLVDGEGDYVSLDDLVEHVRVINDEVVLS